MGKQFNPDEYLKGKSFDPDEYLGIKTQKPKEDDIDQMVRDFNLNAINKINENPLTDNRMLKVGIDALAEKDPVKKAKLEQQLNIKKKSATVEALEAPIVSERLSKGAEQLGQGDVVAGVLNILTGGVETAFAPVSKAFSAGTGILTDVQRAGEELVGLPQSQYTVGELINKVFETSAELPTLGAEQIDKGLDAMGISKEVRNLGLSEEQAQQLIEPIQGMSSLLSQAIVGGGIEKVGGLAKPKEVFKPIEVTQFVRENKIEQHKKDLYDLLPQREKVFTKYTNEKVERTKSSLPELEAKKLDVEQRINDYRNEQMSDISNAIRITEDQLSQINDIAKSEMLDVVPMSSNTNSSLVTLPQPRAKEIWENELKGLAQLLEKTQGKGFTDGVLKSLEKERKALDKKIEKIKKISDPELVEKEIIKNYKEEEANLNTQLRNLTEKQLTGKTKIVTAEEYRAVSKDSQLFSKSNSKILRKAGETIQQYANRIKDIPAVIAFKTYGFQDKLGNLFKYSKSNAGDVLIRRQVYKAHEATIKKWKMQELSKEIVAGKLQEIYGTNNRRELQKVIKNNQVRQTVEMNGQPVKIKQNGKEIDLVLSQAEMINLYNQYKNPKTRALLQNQGYNKRVIDAVESNMTPESLKTADWLITDFANIMYDMTNSTYKIREGGKNLNREEFYTPRAREVNNGKDVVFEYEFDTPTTKPSSIKERVESDAPVKILDAYSVAMNQIERVSHYSSYADFVHELRTVYGDNKIRNIIRYNHGEKKLKAFEETIDLFARGGVDTALSMGTIDKMRANFSTSVLGINPVIGLKQYSAIPAYAIDSPRYLKEVGSTVGKLRSSKGRKELSNLVNEIKDSDFLKSRYGDGWERDVIVYLGQNPTATLLNTKEIKRGFLKFTELGDKMTILTGGLPYYNLKYKEYLKKYSPEIAKKKALKDFEIQTDRLQQSGTLQSMSNYEMGGSFQKAITMLTKGSVQYLRQEFNAIQNLRYGKGSKTQNIKNFAIAHFLLPMTWQFFADGFEWESDEQLRAAIFGNFNSLFLIGGVAETIYDKAILKKRVGDVMQVSPIMSIQKDSEVLAEQAIKMLGDKKITDKDIERTISNMARVAGKTTGLPIDQAIKAVKLVKDLANNDTGDDFDTARRIMGFSKYVIDKNKPKKKKVKPIL